MAKLTELLLTKVTHHVNTVLPSHTLSNQLNKALTKAQYRSAFKIKKYKATRGVPPYQRLSKQCHLHGIDEEGPIRVAFEQVN